MRGARAAALLLALGLAQNRLKPRLRTALGAGWRVRSSAFRRSGSKYARPKGLRSGAGTACPRNSQPAEPGTSCPCPAKRSLRPPWPTRGYPPLFLPWRVASLFLCGMRFGNFTTAGSDSPAGGRGTTGPAAGWAGRWSVGLRPFVGEGGSFGPKTSFALGFLAARLGFEPRQTDPESAVLPLHHRAVEARGAYAFPCASQAPRRVGLRFFPRRPNR